MCEQTVARRIFVRKSEKVRESWREYTARGFIICTSRNTVTAIKYRKMKWAERVIAAGQKRNACVLV